MFANTYHLMLQPGPGRRRCRRPPPLHRPRRPHHHRQRRFPGVLPRARHRRRHRRAQIPASVQAQRRARLILRVDEEGVLFKSYRDGARVLLTPETSVAAQKALGADIIILLDELPSHRPRRPGAKRVPQSSMGGAKSQGTPRGRSPTGDVRGDSRAGGSRVAKDERSTPGSLPFDGFAIGFARQEHGRVDGHVAISHAADTSRSTEPSARHRRRGVCAGGDASWAWTRSTRRSRRDRRGTGRC